MNNVNLIGRMTKDPEIKYSPNGVAITRFTLAVERLFKDKNSGKRETDFISCVAWRKSAENVATYCKKGSQVGVTGRVQTSNFEGKDGNRVFMTEVVCDHVQFLSPSNNSRQNNKQNGSDKQSKPYGNVNQSNPYGNGDRYQSNPFGGQGEPVGVSDDDLPF